MSRLERLLAERPWLLADGATGTTFFAMGLPSGEAPELWNEQAPDNVRALHRGFINAGADLVLTNSFGGTRYRLKLHDAQDRVEPLNRMAATLAREEADAALERCGREIVVAGSMGPTGELLQPVGELSFGDAVAAFEEQGAGLLAGGVDVLWAETISSEEEMAAASEAARRLDAPFSGTMSFDTSGRTMMGVTSTRFAEFTSELPKTPIAFGANCGVGASDLLRSVLGFAAAAPGAALVAKANAGVPRFVDGKIQYDGDPALMARYAVLAHRSGARIIGGCCGTTATHLREMRAALEMYDGAGGPPSLDEISAATGPFSSDTDGAVDAPAAPQRGRRGRRRGGDG